MEKNNDQFILYGRPQLKPFGDPNIPFGLLYLKKLNDLGHKLILIDSDNGNDYKATFLRGEIIHFAECLKYLGIQNGDVIGLCSENRVEFLVAVMAAFCVGATVASISPSYNYDELIHALSLSKPSLIVTTNKRHELLAKIATEVTHIKNIINFDECSNKSNFIQYSALMTDNKIPSSGEFDCVPIEDDRTLIIFCSSGTTGLPKGAELTKLNIFSMLDIFTDFLDQFNAKNGYCRATNFLPWFHSMGFLVSIGLCLSGTTAVFSSHFMENKFYSAIEKYKPNLLVVVPPIIVLMAKSPLTNCYDLSSITKMSSGAAPLRKETIETMKNKFPAISLGQGYGLSETALSVIKCVEDTTPGSAGILEPGVWGKVLDTETGQILGPNKIGELCFKGNVVMKGYIGNRQASTDTIDKDGWLHTGDIGYYNDKFEWFIEDRIKELIKYKGFQVPPAELESVLFSHPKIIDAAVVGLPDNEAGELPVAFVVQKPGSSASEKEIIDFVASKVSNPKRLRGGVRFVAAIPKNLTGKILRRELKKLVMKSKSKL